jgi:hypothetical protein
MPAARLFRPHGQRRIMTARISSNGDGLSVPLEAGWTLWQKLRPERRMRFAATSMENL